MKGKPTTFWGKLTRDDTGEVVDWHPLVDHCADVAACVEALLELPTWRHRLAALGGVSELDTTTCARLAVLGALHDLGKFNIGFQAKGRPELGDRAGHVQEAVSAVDKEVFSALEPLSEWGEGTFGLLVSALCHHGKPYSCSVSLRFEPVLWKEKGGLNPRSGVASLLEACRTWYPEAFRNDAPPLPVSPEFEHAFAGVVMLADWIGSDEQLFKFSNEGDSDRMQFSRSVARNFMREGWLDITSERREDRAERPVFTRIAPTFPNPRSAQRAILQLEVSDEPSITILEAETGSGKTEAALARFAQMFSNGQVDGLYFALPTRTAATEIFTRVRAAMRSAFADPPPVVLAVPGYLQVDDARGQRLAPFEVLWPDTDAERFRFRAWAGESAKRYLAGCVVVGTIDQVLLSSLLVGHAHLRATALLRQLLVVDEVHASDAYMTRILENVLHRQLRSGGHALLLSATLGAESRARLLNSGRRTSLPDFNEAVRTPYPLVSHRSGTVQLVGVAHEEREKQVDVHCRPMLEDDDAVAATALDAAAAGAKVLVIRNTVVNCVATQVAIERLAAEQNSVELLFRCDGQAAPHHSRFSRPDRKKLDDAVQQTLGKDRARGGRVLVATQTVQQSLDIDADLLISDLCPMDVLLQRIGRLHRHSGPRPAGYEVARAIVCVPRDRDLGALLRNDGIPRNLHGLGSVYDDLRILEATWRQIESHLEWRIPAMNRMLVESSVHSQKLEEVSTAGGARWQAHSQWVQGKGRGDQRFAELNLVNWNCPYSETSYPEAEKVSTRLGTDDRRVHFAQSFTGPFGSSISELVLPEYWVKGVAATETEAHDIATVGLVTTFTFADRPFIYDRHGVRPVSKAKSEHLNVDERL